MTIPVGVNNYAQSVGSASDSFLLTYFAAVNPTPQNTQFPVQKRWINTLTSTEFILSGFTSSGGYVLANWVQLTAGVINIETLTGNSGGSIAPTGANINIRGDATTINIVGNPGTSTLTANVILPIKAHEVLLGQVSSISGVDPASVSAGVPFISQGSGADPIFGTALVVGGGTGSTSFNINGAVFSGTTTTGALQSSTLTNGQVLIGGTTTPASATLTAGSGIGISNGNNSITISATSSGYSWVNVVASPQNMSTNTAYTADSASLINFILPATATYGQTYRVVGKGTGLWTVTYSTNQLIHYGDINTTVTSGSLSSSLQYDAVELVCSTSPNEFTVISSIGNLTYI